MIASNSIFIIELNQIHLIYCLSNIHINESKLNILLAMNSYSSEFFYDFIGTK